MLKKIKKMVSFSKVIQFIKYHNAFTIGLVLVFILGGSVLASDAVREAVIGSAIVERQGIDNSVLLDADLDNFDFMMQITAVSEDEQNYFVQYAYKTFSIKDNVWQEIARGDVLSVSKIALGNMDLGLYLKEELGEIIDNELAYLSEVKQNEKQEKGKTFVQETTLYTGLIGMFFDTKTRELPGYALVVAPSSPPVIVYNEPVVPEVRLSVGEVEPPAEVQPQDIDSSSAPDTIIDFQPDALTTSTDAVFEFYCVFDENHPLEEDGSHNACSFQCQVNNIDWAPCESPKLYPALTDGNYTFKVFATNSIGKYDETPASFSWTIDSESSEVEPPAEVQPPAIDPVTATTTVPVATTTDPEPEPEPEVEPPAEVQPPAIDPVTATTTVPVATTTDPVATTTVPVATTTDPVTEVEPPAEVQPPSIDPVATTTDATTTDTD